MKIKYNIEGDEFMADCWRDNGFTCSFHFRNMHANFVFWPKGHPMITALAWRPGPREWNAHCLA